MIQVQPSDLRGRVDHHVRLAVLAGTATWAPGHEGQGDLRKLLADRDRTWAVHRGYQHLSDGELQADRQMWSDRQGEALYRQDADYGEMVDDCIYDLDVEITRRAQA